MIDSQRLLVDLTKLLATLEKDLHQQVTDRPDMRARLQDDYDAARKVGRTKDTFETWSEEPLTQGAAAWILGTVFVRFLEDNELVDPMLSGIGARHTRAQQEHQHYFQQHPTHSDRDYLEHLFGRLAETPATAGLFDRRHNPVWRLPISADAARALVEFWQRIVPDTGQVVYSFGDGALDTRFLGDLYQDLSESVRDRYALLQTPKFVAEFILDHTLTPAVETFGYREVRLIDPTCGSGHFLLDAFDRLLSLSQEHEPGKDVRAIVQDVLSRVVGVDVNPYAVAIASFRLGVAAIRACSIKRLADAPGFDTSVVAADSLLHGPRFNDDGAVQMSVLPDDPSNQYYFSEDETRVRTLLGRQYHAVVGNPPYITVKDPALRDLYRGRYGACKGKYALVVPFMERFFELALPHDGDVTRAGYVGLIVADSFMKREFGKRLIEEYFPRWDLTHVVSTSGAYIPGHGTPTVILFGRHRRPVLDKVRAVMGIRGEPSTPDDAANGLVWTAILDQIDRPGSEGAYVSVSDVGRGSFHRHPWSIGGGGAAGLKELLEQNAPKRLSELVALIGVIGMTNADDIMISRPADFQRRGISRDLFRSLGAGDEIRDWALSTDTAVWFPYQDDQLLPLEGRAMRWFWPARTTLGNRATFSGGTYFRDGRPWWEWHQICLDRLDKSATIAFAAVATHNHFVLDDRGIVFKQSAFVIKMKDSSTVDDCHFLLGLLNSSMACFWMKQVCHNKGATSDKGVLQGDPERFRFDFDATKLAQFPVPEAPTRLRDSVIMLSRKLVEGAERLTFGLCPESIDSLAASVTMKRDLDILLNERAVLRRSMVRWQEELDWVVYELFNLLPSDSPARSATADAPRIDQVGMEPGDRAYRRFDAHSATLCLAPDIDSARAGVIGSDDRVRLLERPEYKRRWFRSAGAYDGSNLDDSKILHRGTADWMAQRLESTLSANGTAIISVNQLTDLVRNDAQFNRVGEVHMGDEAFDPARVVEEVVSNDAVAGLAVLRYTDAGLSKRSLWERTWNLQRQEDAGVKIGSIPVPPKYTSADFRSDVAWRLRGRFDVPRERFIGYPGCERAVDGSMPIAWAGLDDAQQARALGAFYMQIKTEEGTVLPKLVPLLAGLLELLPWVRQWHAGTDPEFGLDLGDYYADFVDSEARTLGLTVDELRAWKPEPKAKKGKKPKQA